MGGQSFTLLHPVLPVRRLPLPPCFPTRVPFVPNWPVQSRAGKCAHAKQVKTPPEMQTLLGRRILFMVNYGLFLTVSLTRPVTRPLALA